MIISKSSILNNLPNDKLSEREIIFIESIVHSINIIDTSYSRLVSCLYKNDDDMATESPLIDVWNVIDSAHRLRCILDKAPGIKKKETWFQISIRKLKETEDIRHFIQHYDREVDNLISEVKPLLGHLSWLFVESEDRFQVGLIVPGTLRKFQGLALVNPMGKSVRSRIDLITFNIGKYQVSISDIYFQLIDLVIGLENHIKEK